MRDVALTPAEWEERAERARQRRLRQYAAKWRAETVRAEPPVALEPTDDNLAAVLGHEGLTRPARPEEFPAIREAIAQYDNEKER